MTGQVITAVLSILTKSLVESDLQEDLLSRLQQEYNMAGGELFSRGMDLVQTKVGFQMDNQCHLICI